MTSRVPTARSVGFVLSGILVVLGFSEALADLLARGAGQVDQGYIVLAPIAALYLVLVRRTQLRVGLGRAGSGIGLVVVGLGLLLSRVGQSQGVLVAWHAGPLVAFVGAAICWFGRHAVARLAPAIGALFFVVPVPGAIRQYLAQPLQQFAATMAAWLMGGLGLDVVLSGNTIIVNGVSVAVGEACNGMRLFMPLAIVMYAFAFSIPLGGPARAGLLVMCAPVALICNVLRLAVAAVAFGYFGDYGEPVHDLMGWLMIPASILVLVGLLRMVEWLDISPLRYRLASV